MDGDQVWFLPSDACDLTLDPNTANYELILSEGGKKATRGAKQSYPDHPERFDESRQVLCREALTGRCYWEVEWNGYRRGDVHLGVCYKGLERKGNSDACILGNNNMSWCFRYNPHPVRLMGASQTFCLRHNNESQHRLVPPAGCPRLGVFLDWPAGTLSFYVCSSDRLNHIYTFKHRFSEPVYPGFFFWASPNTSIFLCS